MTAAKYANQCRQAITAAQNATAAGTWVYSIAYAAETSSALSCKNDMVKISACTTMQYIASDGAKFYSDVVGGASSCTSAAHSISELVSVFSAIADSFKGSRLLPDNAT